ncbi:Insertion element protein [Frankia gtarii]|uniref:Insertion element protein n=1 Tax=Frankia gtarii TaxID=2950102 RepID=UPI0021BF0539|nr:Insertion element protein [Frankia gtarii]
MAGSDRAVPFYCPYCGEEDIVPEPAADGAGSGHGHWACRSCRRGFRLSLTALVVAAGPAGSVPVGTPGATGDQAAAAGNQTAATGNQTARRGAARDEEETT